MTGQSRTLIRCILPTTILCLSLYLFPSVLDTIILLGNVETKMLVNWKNVEAFRESRIPLGGEYVLPPEVQVMITMLRRSGADSFRYSDAIRSNGGMTQRLVEGAYPIRVSPGSRFLVLLEGEPLPAGMNVLASGEGVVLAYRS